MENLYDKLYLAVYLKRPQMIGILFLLYPLYISSKQVTEDDDWAMIIPAFLGLLCNGFGMKYLNLAVVLIPISGFLFIILSKKYNNIIGRTLTFLYGTFQICIGLVSLVYFILGKI